MFYIFQTAAKMFLIAFPKAGSIHGKWCSLKDLSTPREESTSCYQNELLQSTSPVLSFFWLRLWRHESCLLAHRSPVPPWLILFPLVSVYSEKGAMPSKNVTLPHYVQGSYLSRYCELCSQRLVQEQQCCRWTCRYFQHRTMINWALINWHLTGSWSSVLW